MSNQNLETKTCQNCKNNFVITPDDLGFYEKIKVPTPTFCPECRLIRRLCFRNERALYPRKCAMCDSRIICHYAPESDYVIYCRDCWWSDKWDPISYGKSFDFTRSFFEQYADLKKSVPLLPLQEYGNNVNALFSSYLKDVHNTYLSFSVAESEGVYYSRTISNSLQVFDSFDVTKGEFAFECIGCSKVFQSEHLLYCSNCIQCYFLFDCVNCQNCFMSSNLRNKQYFFRNKQLTKEEYGKEIRKIDFSSYNIMALLKAELENLSLNSIHKYGYFKKINNSTGNDLENTDNAKWAFEGFELKNVKYTCRVFRSKEVYDVFGFAGGEFAYEGINIGSPSNNVAFVMNTNPQGHDLRYCENQSSGSDLFGCIGVRNKQYCILNKQYTKEEYEKLLPKIIEHMDSFPYVDKGGRVYKYGEFFPIEFSPYAYNESTAVQYFNLDKKEAIKRGFRWRDETSRNYEITLNDKDIPDSINDAKDSILDDIVECEHGGSCLHQCTKAFRIIKDELEFYRTRHIPLPHLCPNCRHYERLRLRNPLNLWTRTCMCDKSNHGHEGKCEIEFETSYTPDRPEMVYCEKCYQQEVV